MKQKPYLNLGCGKMLMPRPKPAHYSLISDGLTDYALWDNVDKHHVDGVQVVANIFEYPWDWAEDNSYDGALLAHLAEHIPHGEGETDGFYQFFGELHRVLTAGAMVHVLSPYAFSFGAMVDPTHTRYLLPQTFDYFRPDNDAPFIKEGVAFEIKDVRYGLTEHGKQIANTSTTSFYEALATQLNVASEFYIKLEVIKDEQFQL